MAAKKKSVKKKTAKKKTPKKAVKKKTSKKGSVKKSQSKSVSKKSSPKKVRATKRKISFVLRNLVLFIVLSLLSFLLYSVSEDPLYVDFFSLLTWILGFIGVAFLIALLVLVLLKAMKK